VNRPKPVCQFRGDISEDQFDNLYCLGQPNLSDLCNQVLELLCGVNLHLLILILRLAEDAQNTGLTITAILLVREIVIFCIAKMFTRAGRSIE
jgi:hypothetical protein